MRMRWSRNEMAAMVVKNQSTPVSADPRTEAGSCGRGCGGGGVTNWNRIVMSAERDLPARALVERQRPAGPLLLNLAGLLELRQRDDLVADGDAGVHAVREVRDVLAAARLEQEPVARQRIGRDDEHVLRRLPDGDVLALADQPLFDDSSALDDPDPEDLGLGSRSHLRLSGRCLGRHSSVPFLLCAHALFAHASAPPRTVNAKRCPESSGRSPASALASRS